LRPLYAVEAAEAACAASDSEVCFFCDCGGEEYGVFVGFAMANAGVKGHAW
jgi:hypothetical protein